MAERDKLSKDEYKKIMSRPESKGKDPWTILDVFNAVKLQNIKDPFSGTKAKDWAHNPFEETMHSVDLAMEEENPLAGGTFEGRTYYSNTLPKGKDKTPWSKEASIIVRNAAQHNAKKSEILKAQKYFTSIGYMDESEIDGYKGKQLMGMIHRWNLNAGTSVEAVQDAISDRNIFKRDK